MIFGVKDILGYTITDLCPGQQVTGTTQFRQRAKFFLAKDHCKVHV